MRLFVTERLSFGGLLAHKLGCVPYDEADGAKRWHSRDVGVISIGGALARLAGPEVYHPDLASWDRIDLLPVFPDRFMWRIERDAAADLLRHSCQLANLVVIATDASREGEAVGLTAVRLAGWAGPTLRLWRTDNSSRSVDAALANLRRIEDSSNYAQAAAIRAEGDWVEGMNCTRIIANKISWRGLDGRPAQGPKSGIGRVQGFAFSRIAAADVAREGSRAIKAHGFLTTFSTQLGPIRMVHIGVDPIRDRGEAERERTRLTRVKDVVISVSNRLDPVPPPPPFDEPLLQITANEVLGWSLDKTVRIIIALYEAGLITHRHADVRRYGPETAAAAHSIAQALAAGGYWPAGLRAELRSDLVATSLSAVGHGAIAPTGELAGFDQIPEEKRADAVTLFRMIVERFACGHCEDGTDSVAAAECIDDDLRTHRALTRRIQHPGWRRLTTSETARQWLNAVADIDNRPRPDRAEAPWPEYEGVGDHASLAGEVPDAVNGLVRAVASEAETLIIGSPPPPRLTPLTLRSLLEDATPAMSAETLASLPPGPHPIGAASTRLDVINKLLEREIIFQDVDGTLRLSSAGRSLHAFLSTFCPELLEVGKAAAFEHIIRAVEHGELSPAEARTVIQTRNLRIIRSLLGAPTYEGEILEKKQPRFDREQRGSWQRPEEPRQDDRGRGADARTRQPGNREFAGGRATAQRGQSPRGSGHDDRRSREGQANYGPSRDRAASGPPREAQRRDGPPSRPVPANAVWLTVPFEKKQEAKDLGARWSDEKKKWWVDPDLADWRMLRQKGFLKR